MDLNAIASLPETLKIMAFGMLGIFVVTAAIIIAITLLNLITNPIKKRKRSGGNA